MCLFLCWPETRQCLFASAACVFVHRHRYCDGFSANRSASRACQVSSQKFKSGEMGPKNLGALSFKKGHNLRSKFELLSASRKPASPEQGAAAAAAARAPPPKPECVCVCVRVYVYYLYNICIYIYICIEREREREREREIYIYHTHTHTAEG